MKRGLKTPRRCKYGEDLVKINILVVSLSFNPNSSAKLLNIARSSSSIQRALSVMDQG